MNVILQKRSMTSLVKLLQKQGFRIGNKLSYKLRIPVWIKKDDRFIVACLRGIFDTDGCLFVTDKKYGYYGVSLTSYSESLRKDVRECLGMIGLSKFFINGKTVIARSQGEVDKFIDIIKPVRISKEWADFNCSNNL